MPPAFVVEEPKEKQQDEEGSDPTVCCLAVQLGFSSPRQC